jgi:hypothetical protein
MVCVLVTTTSSSTKRRLESFKRVWRTMGVKKKAAKRYLEDKKAEDKYWENYINMGPWLVAIGLLVAALVFIMTTTPTDFQ